MYINSKDLVKGQKLIFVNVFALGKMVKLNEICIFISTVFWSENLIKVELKNGAQLDLSVTRFAIYKKYS